MTVVTRPAPKMRCSARPAAGPAQETPVPDDPNARFDRWLTEAHAAEDLAEAMSLATVDAAGAPSVRMVLLKDHGPDGFTFYTNFGSPKARDLDADPRAAAAFHWKSLRRQVRISGTVARVPDDVADAYFATRPRLSRIGAWASRQSEPRRPLELEARVARFTNEFGLGAIPRPGFWGGYVLRPETIEFWRDRAFRLHERTLYTRTADGWERTELQP